jgi:hypothetical protein
MVKAGATVFTDQPAIFLLAICLPIHVSGSLPRILAESPPLAHRLRAGRAVLGKPPSLAVPEYRASAVDVAGRTRSLPQASPAMAGGNSWRLPFVRSPREQDEVDTTMDQGSQQLLFATFAYLMAIGGLIAALGAAFGS